VPIVLGVAGIVLGTAVAAYGTRVFYLLLPVWGAVVGFLVGAELVSAVFGDRLFATLLGWIVGIGLGVMLAVVAGLAFRIAVVILALSVGYWVGSGLLVALGLEPGLVTSAGGAIMAAALGILAIYADGPRLLVAALTAWGGAAIGIAGALVLVGAVEPAGLREVGPVGALRGDPLAMIAWLVGGGLAFVFQWTETARLADEQLDGAAA
jgi:hypothetical protein